MLRFDKFNHKKLMWLHDSLKFLGIFVAFFVLFRFVIGFAAVDGLSMYPTLTNGEFVVYLRTVKTFKPGDIVCVWVPSGNYYVKRVAAVGGDQVEIIDGDLYVNGESSADYSYGVTEEENGAVIYPYLVSQDNYFVVGDNREVSMDSRAFGEVSRLQIRGKIIFSFGGEK